MAEKGKIEAFYMKAAGLKTHREETETKMD